MDLFAFQILKFRTICSRMLACNNVVTAIVGSDHFNLVKNLRGPFLLNQEILLLHFLGISLLLIGIRVLQDNVFVVLLVKQPLLTRGNNIDVL